MPSGCLLFPGLPSRIGGEAPGCSLVDCVLDPSCIGIHPEYATAIRAQQLHRELSDQSESNDDSDLSERRRGQSQALECDGTDSCKRRVFQGQRVGNSCHEVFRDGV